MLKEKARPQSWTESKLPDGSRVFGSRAFGKGGTGPITLLVNGKVAVGVCDPAFEEQKRKVISRFKVDDMLLADLETALYAPFDGLSSQILREITQIGDQVQFDRRLDVLNSTLRALRELRLKRFETSTGRRFMVAIRTLAREHKRPPTKAEITTYLCCNLSQTSKWCRDRGFSWLPNAPAGRQKERRGRRS